jgi:hypothetical protein
MILSEVEGEEAPQQGWKLLLPPTASTFHHSKTCSGSLILPSEQKYDIWLALQVQVKKKLNIDLKTLVVGTYLAVGF